MPRKPEPFRQDGVTFFPPGTRRGNRTFVVRATVNAPDEERGGLKRKRIEAVLNTGDRKDAPADWRRWLARYEAALEQCGQAADRPVTFAQAADRFITARDPRPDDLRCIRRAQQDSFGALALAAICQDDIAQLARRLYPKAKASTRNRNVYTVVAGVLHYAAANQWCGYMRVRKEREDAVEPRAPSPEVAAAFMASAEGDLADLLLWLFRQGWRITDSVTLPWERVDLARGLVAYHVAKTDEWLTAPLHDDVVKMLRRRLEDRGDSATVFPYRDRWEVYDAIRPLSKKLGVHFTPHQARHFFATMLRALPDVELDEIAAAGAWKDIKSVLRYGRVSPEKVRTTINRVR